MEPEAQERRVRDDNDDEESDEGHITTAQELGLLEMRSERTMHSMAAATAAALRGGSLSEQLRNVVGASNVPLDVRAADEPLEEIQPQRIVREMTFIPRGSSDTKSKRGRKR
jgi:hypothetical protein